MYWWGVYREEVGFQEKGKRVGGGQRDPSLQGLLRDTGQLGSWCF